MPKRSGRPSTRDCAEREGPHGRVLRAISHESRRHIVLLLAQGPRPVHELADAFEVSRPMVSKHLRTLAQAGLVEADLVGRERIYSLAIGPDVRLAVALSEQDAAYADALNRLKQHLGTP
ncbi:MAG: ArsR/SmtB family transcription factor [Thermoplasmatota archaeon]